MDGRQTPHPKIKIMRTNEWMRGAAVNFGCCLGMPLQPIEADLPGPRNWL